MAIILFPKIFIKSFAYKTSLFVLKVFRPIAHKILFEGQGTCDNNTRCICYENYGGVGLHFDVGDTDCPTHLLAFRSLAYVQFGCGNFMFNAFTTI